MSVKNSVASKAATSVQCRQGTIPCHCKASIRRARWSLAFAKVACMLPSFFGASASVLSTLKKCCMFPVATRWCFRRSRRPRTWIRKRLHTFIFFRIPAEDGRKEFSCFQSRNKCTVLPRHHSMALQSLYLQSALVPCLCKSGLHVAKFFGACTSVLSTSKKCFGCVGDTMMCVCKFTNATLLHMLVPRRQNRAKPRVGRVE